MGWLSRENGRWSIRSRSLPPGKADLWVIVPQDDKRGRWKKIGEVAAGKPRILDGDNASMAEGRPVFVMTHPTG